MTWRGLRMLARFGGDASGVSAVEFALMTPILALTLVALVDLGLAINARLTLEKELNVAQLYALESKDNISQLQTYLDGTMTTNLTSKGFAFEGTEAKRTASSMCVCPTNAAQTDLSAYSVSCSTSCGGTNPYLFYRIDVITDYALPLVPNFIAETSDLSCASNVTMNKDGVRFCVTRYVQINGG